MKKKSNIDKLYEYLKENDIKVEELETFMEKKKTKEYYKNFIVDEMFDLLRSKEIDRDLVGSFSVKIDKQNKQKRTTIEISF